VKQARLHARAFYDHNSKNKKSENNGNQQYHSKRDNFIKHFLSFFGFPQFAQKTTSFLDHFKKLKSPATLSPDFGCFQQLS
jgi:hypothetical protein